MAVNNPCAEYAAYLDRWVVMNDVCDGAKAVKLKPYVYLPAPKSFDEARYRAYAERALFFKKSIPSGSNVGSSLNAKDT